MRKRHFIAVLAATVVLGGCSWLFPKAKSEAPEVTVKNGKISVEPEPLRFKVGGPPVDIVWQSDGKTRFAENGIVIDGEVERIGGPVINPKQDQIIECRALEQGQKFTCKNLRSRKGLFKYTVRLIQDGKPLPPHDPGIMNME